jgi:transmembrane sensor
MIEKYAAYSVEDFVGDQDFIVWAKSGKGLEGSLWQHLLEKYPAQEPVIRQARQVVVQFSEASAMTFEKEDASDIWENIESQLFTAQSDARQRPLYRSFWAVAASITILIGLGWSAYYSLQSRNRDTYSKLVQQVDNPLQEVVNKSQQTMIVELPDGSRITLAAHSKLSYAKDFTKKTRDVYLSGEAFFDVAKNPEKPFIVYANELVTKVLGTSFNVKAFEDDNRVTVAVKTGRVSVFANRYSADIDPETKGIILIPNQQAYFQRESETISRSLVEQPKIVIEKKELEKFSFNNAPVSEIFDAMENAYGVDFLYEPEVVASCRLTTSLSEETLFEKLDVICEAIGATYKVVDAQIVIDAKRCN